jgi:hypothetical protein
MVKGDPVPLTDFRPSGHAIARMIQRDIYWPTILAVIAHGIESTASTKRFSVFRYDGYSVVVGGRTVVTVFRRLSGRKKEQIRSRRLSHIRNRRFQKRGKQISLWKLDKVIKRENPRFF